MSQMQNEERFSSEDTLKNFFDELHLYNTIS